MPKTKKKSLDTKNKLRKLARAKKIEDLSANNLVNDKTKILKRDQVCLTKEKSREDEQHEQVRQHDKENDKISKENAEKRAKKKAQKKELIAKKRQDKDFRDREKEKDKMNKRKVRENKSVRQKYNQVQKEIMAKKREDENFRENEKIINKVHKKNIRQNETVKEQHKKSVNECKSKKRQDKSYREKEKEADKTAKKQVRKEETVKQKHNLLHKEYLSQKRKEEEYREKEKERDKNKKSQQRLSNPALLEAEAERISQKRKHEDYRELERIRDKEAKRRKKVLEKAKSVVPPSVMVFPPKNVPKHSKEYFRYMIKEGPTGVCIICTRLFFPRMMVKTKKLDQIRIERPELYEKVYNYPASEKCCNTCLKYLGKNEPSNFCASQYQIIYDMPERFKDLTTLEERLVALRIPFMQIRAWGREKQCTIKGSVVNVPIDTSTVVSALPRNLHETETIQVKLKRKQSHENAYLMETIRPAKVLGALEYLLTQPLYANVNLNEGWLEQLQRDAAGDIRVQHDDIDEIISSLPTPAIEAEETVDDDLMETLSFDDDLSQLSDLFEKLNALEEQAKKQLKKKPVKETVVSEFDQEDDNDKINPGGEETMLDERDPLSNLVLAPGENQLPKHIMLDEWAEEMSFPTIFAGNKKTFVKKMLYFNQAKIQASNVDRRFARTDFLLYMYKKKQLISINVAIQMAIRKMVDGNNQQLTVQDVINSEYLKNMIKKDQGFGFMNSIRSAPAFWQKQTSKGMAMLRQYGSPTFFITISAAESLWAELLVVLSQVVDHKHLSEEEALRLKSEEKCRLIRTDPITCARYFDNRFHLLMNHLRSDFSVFKEHQLVHYYYRVEFQQRGSPHVHMLTWHENTPELLPKANDVDRKKICDFIDKYVSCDSSLPEVADLMPLQRHKHNKSCKKVVKGKTTCRFDYPCYPMDETMIIYPLSPQEVTNTDRKEAIRTLLRINEFLSTSKELDGLTFADFLKQMGCTKEFYVNCIRTVNKKTFVVQKREPKDVFVNNFNKDILELQRSNMDIKFVLDPYSCLAYIFTYMNKANRGVSKILMDTMNEINQKNVDVVEQFKLIGKRFINASEVSAQEAAYDILQLHMSEADTFVAFINTQPKQKRVRVLKTKGELKKMAKEDTNIFKLGRIEQYVQRPNSIEDVCLAKFIAYYDITRNSTELKLKECDKFLKLRTKPCVINFNFPSFQEDPVNFYRTELMLYVPWRDEERELLNIDHEAIYQAYFSLIEKNSEEFNKLPQGVLEAAREEAEKHLREGFEDEDFVHDNEYGVYDIDRPDDEPIVILGNNNSRGKDKTSNKKGKDDTFSFPTPYQIEEAEFRKIISELNHKQHDYLSHVLDNIVSNKKFLEVVVGGAGVGKSRMIVAIYQSLLRHFNSIPGNNPETIKVLLTAPTGKASFAIKGITIHSSFCMPVNTSNEPLLPLNYDKANTLYTLLSELKLIIIDEFSMVGSNMLEQIHTRLMQIFKNDRDFGDISIIMLGDLNQLAPVGDAWIFRPNNRNVYGSLSGTYLWDQFAFYELTEVMRQREDLKFAKALNNMANNKMTGMDVKLFSDRQVEVYDNIVVPENIIHLFSTNTEVDAFNEQRLSTFKTECAVSDAVDMVKGNVPEKVRVQLLKKASFLTRTECRGLMSQIKLQIGARYMISMNIDTKDGIVNGATGLLRKIDYEKNDPKKPDQIWIEFMDQDVGVVARKEAQQNIAAAGHPDTWTPIQKAARTLQARKGQPITVERKQFPVFVAEGITIHKAQGGTYQQVAVHLTKGMPKSSLYVACSRATTINGLYIFGKFKQPTSNKIIASSNELIKLRENKSLVTKFDKQYVNGSILVTHQSVRFLNKELRLIRSNPLFKNAHIAIFEDDKSGAAEKEVEDDAQYAPLNEQFRMLVVRTIDDSHNIVCFYREPVMEMITRVSAAKTHQTIIARLTNDDGTIAVLDMLPNVEIFEGALAVDGVMPNNETAKYLLIGKWHDSGNVQKVVDHLPTLEIDLINKTIDDHAVCTFVSRLHGSKYICSETHATVHSKNLAISIRISEKEITPDSKGVRTKTPPSSASSAPPTKMVESSLMDIEEEQSESSLLDDKSDSSLMSINDDKSNDDDNEIVLSSQISSVSVISYENNDDAFYKNKGLQNRDNVSCYANATLQSLFSLTEFRHSMLQHCDENDECREIVKIMRSETRECLQLRQMIGNPFDRREQQDVQEFFMQLLSTLPIGDIFNVAGHETVIKCNECGHIDQGRSTETNTWFLEFPGENDRAEISFEDLYGYRPTPDLTCSRCQQNVDMSSKSTILNVNRYLTICIKRYHADRKITTKIGNFQQNSVTIDDLSFRVRAVIKHLGEDINAGHYVSQVKYNESWLLCNDLEITQTNDFDDTLKDVYLMILEIIQ